MNPLAGLTGTAGVGFRPEIATVLLAPDRDGGDTNLRTDLSFVELVAETVPADGPLHPVLQRWLDRDLPAIPHGVGLGLGGADEPDAHRLDHLRHAVERLGAPLASEHLSFVRAGAVEAGHLLPIAFDDDSFAVVAANIRIVQHALPVPLAVEPVATVFRWPASPGDRSEAEFLHDLCDGNADLLLLVDVANVVCNAANDGDDHDAVLDRWLDVLPWERVAYLHVAGGERVGDVWHDTHRHSVWPEAIDLIRAIAARTPCPPALLERDDDFPDRAELDDELARITAACAAP